MSKGCVIWLTGLPGAGKTTIAKLLEKSLENIGHEAEVLDGDEIRKSLSPELGFSKTDREIHAKRVVYLCKLLSKHGVIVIVALISPFRSFRQFARESIGEGYTEVWVKASVETCRKRDPKGLYKKALNGDIKNLTGPQDPYEPPINPELTIETESEGAIESAERIMKFLRERHMIDSRHQKSSKIAQSN